MTGADLSQLNGRELDKEIAAALGWVDLQLEIGGYWTGVPPSDGDWKMHRASVNHFSTSLDALSAGPERVLREAGRILLVNVYENEHANARWAESGLRGWVGAVCNAPDEKLARARACLAALTALKEQEAR